MANIAKRYNKPVIGIAGSLTADAGVVREHVFHAVFSVISYHLRTFGGRAEEMRVKNVRMTARNVAATLKAGGQTVTC